MSCFRVLLAAAIVLRLLSPATAEQSHYLYYRVQSGETLVSVAVKHGVDRGVILSMNPRLQNPEASLTPGTVIFVPNPDYGPKTAPAPEPKPEPNPEPAAAKVVIESEDPSQDELHYLATYATAGAPAPPPPQPSRPNVFIGSDGRRVEVPVASGKVQQTQRSVAHQRRRELSSRRGRALFALLKTARSFMGIPYVWGGESPTGADCSGYVQMVFARHGVTLPRTADVQFKVGQRVKDGDEQPGDLVFFETYAPGASHVGIYLGRRMFIHASSRARKVTISSLDEEYLKKRYLGARRNL